MRNIIHPTALFCCSKRLQRNMEAFNVNGAELDTDLIDTLLFTQRFLYPASATAVERYAVPRGSRARYGLLPSGLEHLLHAVAGRDLSQASRGDKILTALHRVRLDGGPGRHAAEYRQRRRLRIARENFFAAAELKFGILKVGFSVGAGIKQGDFICPTRPRSSLIVESAASPTPAATSVPRLCRRSASCQLRPRTMLGQ